MSTATDTTSREHREAELAAKVEAWIEAQPAEIDCETHPGQKRRLAVDTTREKCLCLPYGPDGFDSWRPQYYRCPVCLEELKAKRLRNAGVPKTLLHCSLDNWTPRNKEEEETLAAVREYAGTVRKGFLILLGPVGVGKSHLGVGVMRHFESTGNVWVKQSTLLRELRATYIDKQATDPIKHCQAGPLLVLDEMGVSGGGKDEWPMLSEILRYRYEERRATIITSNLTWEELQAELGDRLADRMREAAYRVLVFSGASHRPEQRETYFK